ncbi:MAG: GIY-YIG nuclease family protein [Immundisolibacter sp.]|uniref:GIY-YIG nuclease family protein n=1 Tax=Immundisolibacter sp. TaxID=1934948 RepID=UPI003D0A3F63
MAIRGWVYVITNEAMPGLLKVGHSTKDPALRAQELASTGTPTPFAVEYDALVINPVEVEKVCHKRLAEYRKGKEWFACNVAIAVKAISEAAGGNLLLETWLRKPLIAPRRKLEASGGPPAVNLSRAAPSSRPTITTSALEAIAARSDARRDYVCRHCGKSTNKPESHIFKCNYCGKHEVLF